MYSVCTIPFLPQRESTLLLRTWRTLSFVILSNLWSGKEEKGETEICQSSEFTQFDARQETRTLRAAFLSLQLLLFKPLNYDSEGQRTI